MGVTKEVQCRFRRDRPVGKLGGPPLYLLQALVAEGPEGSGCGGVPLPVTLAEQLFESREVAAEGCQLPVPGCGPGARLVRRSRSAVLAAILGTDEASVASSDVPGFAGAAAAGGRRVGRRRRRLCLPGRPRSWLCLDYGQRLLALQSRRERRGLADLPPLVVRPGLAARALEPHGLFAPETLEMTLV